MKQKIFYNLLSVLVFIIVLAIWQFFSVSVKIKFFFGSPYLIFQSITQNSGALFSDTIITGVEALLGFLIGILCGTIVGFLLWYSPLIARISKPYIIIAGAIPIFAFAPIVILWFGIGITMKIAMAAFGAFLISLTQAYEGANSIDLEEYRLLKIFGASRFQVLKKIIFPAALSWVLTSMKLCVGFSLLGAFIGEFISADRGLGHFMLRAGSLYDIPSVFAGGFFLILLAILFNYFVILIERNKMKIVEFFSVDQRLRTLLNK
jgi:NitT/TauT family transport system permease protein